MKDLPSTLAPGHQGQPGCSCRSLQSFVSGDKHLAKVSQNWEQWLLTKCQTPGWCVVHSGSSVSPGRTGDLRPGSWPIGLLADGERASVFGSAAGGLRCSALTGLGAWAGISLPSILFFKIIIFLINWKPFVLFFLHISVAYCWIRPYRAMIFLRNNGKRILFFFNTVD